MQNAYLSLDWYLEGKSMKEVLLAITIAITAISIPAHANEAKKNVWAYNFQKSDFSNNFTSACIVSEPTRSLRGLSQGILTISFDESDSDKENPSVSLILHEAITSTCIDFCFAMVNIDGEKKPPMMLTSHSSFAYSFDDSVHAYNTFKNAKNIKLAVKLFPDDIAVYEFEPKSALDLNKLPSQ